MTWEIDILQRAGRLHVIGRFNITDAAEVATFNLKFLETARRAGITAPVIAPTNPKPSPPPAPLEQIKVRVKQQGGDLTPREKQIHKLMVAGNSNKQIAIRLGINVNTVKTHTFVIRKKLMETAQ